MEPIKDFILKFLSVVQAGKIYSAAHPQFKDLFEKSYADLKEILRQRGEFAIGIVEGELTCGEEIFFDLSAKLRPLLMSLEERGIQRLRFSKGLKEEEWMKLLQFLSLPKGEIPHNIQSYLLLQGIKNIDAGKLLAPQADQEVKIKLDFLQRLYETSLREIAQFIEKILGGKDVDSLEARFQIFSLLENFAGMHQELLNIVTMRKKDLMTYIHLLNTSVLAMFFSSRLGFSREDVLEIGMAGLFHDVGKLAIPLHILAPGGQQAEEESPEMKSHALLGANILLRYVDSIGILAVVVAFEHHLRYNFKGYPAVQFRRPPHLASLLISICDVYDALNQKRAYRDLFTPPKIYQIMTNEKGHLFNPDLLDKFFGIMGVWPVGLLVSLSDGRIAVVRKVNDRDIFRPQVEVIYPPDQREWIDLAEEETRYSIQDSLNPFGEGRKYLKFLPSI